MAEQDAYQKLVEWLNNPVWELTESEAMMPMFTSYISPEEAEFMTGIPLNARTLEEIAEIKEMDPAEVEPKIKALCEKGLMYESIRGNSSRYKLLDAQQMFLRMPFWGGGETEELKAVSHWANKYYMDGWYDQMKPVREKALRAIPIQKTMEDTRTCMPFENITQVVDSYEYYTVSHCPCRQRHKLDPDYQESAYPSETCLHFDDLGRHIVKHGLGREITKEETLEILKKAADAGLVHGISNQEEKPDTICNCDPIYCTMFRPYHLLGHSQSMNQSNYQVRVAPESCKACGLCVKRCPMDALELKVSGRATSKFNKAVSVDTDICIGCGVCVHKCPTDSITLERREGTTMPPKTGRDWMNAFITDRLVAKEKEAQSE
jgi:NAD-dependent dihydropyrimidine dehydrogenase PreA subunit